MPWPVFPLALFAATTLSRELKTVIPKKFPVTWFLVMVFLSELSRMEIPDESPATLLSAMVLSVEYSELDAIILVVGHIVAGNDVIV